MNRPPKLCFVDVETTGTDPLRHGVIQIGALVCATQQGLEDLDTYVSHVCPFPADAVEAEALEVNGVSREALRSFPPPATVHRQLTEMLARHCNRYDKTDKMFFVGFNAAFDYRFLRRWFEKAGDKYFGSWFWHPAVDVMTLAAAHLMDVRATLPDFKLATVAAHLGVALETAHDALADARATKALFARLFGGRLPSPATSP